MGLLPQIPVEMQILGLEVFPPPSRENNKGRASEASRHQHWDSC